MPSKLQPLNIPHMKWECICMDFVIGLPAIQGGYDFILVIVDLLTVVAHLIPIKKIFKYFDIACLFVKEPRSLGNILSNGRIIL